MKCRARNEQGRRSRASSCLSWQEVEWSRQQYAGDENNMQVRKKQEAGDKLTHFRWQLVASKVIYQLSAEIDWWLQRTKVGYFSSHITSLPTNIALKQDFFYDQIPRFSAFEGGKLGTGHSWWSALHGGSHSHLSLLIGQKIVIFNITEMFSISVSFGENRLQIQHDLFFPPQIQKTLDQNMFVPRWQENKKEVWPT